VLEHRNTCHRPETTTIRKTNPEIAPPGGPLLTLATGAAIVSFSPILVKAAGQWGMGPTAIAVWRCLLGALFVAGLAGILRARMSAPRSVMGLLVLAGLAFALDLFVWHRAIVLTGAGMATILGSVQVFGTAVLSAALFREALTGRFLLSATAALGGVVLLVGVGSDVAFTPDYMKGIGYGLATGLLYSVFLVSLRTAGRRSRDLSSLVSLFWFSLIAGLLLLGISGVESTNVLPTNWQAWTLVALLALLAQSLGWWTIARSLPRVEGAAGGLVLLLQPVLATIWGVLIFGETLAPLQIAGAAITLVAVYLGSVKA
jgi:drug/metabolite transporter (DMT)-like permease